MDPHNTKPTDHGNRTAQSVPVARATQSPAPEASQLTPSYPDILVTIFHVDTVTEPIEFHWAFFVQYPDSKFGIKIHVTDISDTWKYDTWPFTLTSSNTAAAALIIGQIPKDKTIEDLEKMLKMIPMNVVPEEDKYHDDKFDCQVWLREGVRRLIKEKWIKCRDARALLDEVQVLGEEACREINNSTFIQMKIERSERSY